MAEWDVVVLGSSYVLIVLLHGGPPAEVTVPKDCWVIFIGPGLWLSEAVVGSDGVFGGKGFWGTLIFSLLLGISWEIWILMDPCPVHECPRV